MFADITPTEAKYLYSGDFIREILTIWHARYIKKWFEFICYISYKLWMQQWNSPALLLMPRKSKLWQNQDLIFFCRCDTRDLKINAQRVHFGTVENAFNLKAFSTVPKFKHFCTKYWNLAKCKKHFQCNFTILKIGTFQQTLLTKRRLIKELCTSRITWTTVIVSTAAGSAARETLLQVKA